jgi:general secretion pathway protein I
MLRRTHPAHKRPGLTLLEVILSLAIFLFALVAIGHLMTMGTERAADVRSITRATELCQWKLNEVIAGVVPLASQSDSPFDNEPDYVWTLDCQQDSVANLWDVQVKVSRANKNGSSIEVVLQQMVLDPSARGSTADAAAATDSTSSSSSGSGSSANSQTNTAASGAVSGGAAPAAASKTGAATPAASTSTRTSTPAASPAPAPSPAPASNPSGSKAGGSTKSGG